MKIGTRGSPLALAQAYELRRLYARAHGIDVDSVEIVIIKTTGDAIQDRALSEAGGKGLFTKELDIALMRGDVDIAVHSAKDLPTVLPTEIGIAGYLPREDVRDAWISMTSAHPRDLPRGAVVGTASLRRGAMVQRLRPDLQVRLLRGNVQTRLAKVESAEFDATLLALAGLKRLGLEAKATSVLAIEDFLPAAGQGAIAITARSGDAAVNANLAPILDVATGLALRAERAFLRVLDGSCRTPIGAHASLSGDELTLRGIILRPDGSQSFDTTLSGPATDAEVLGENAGRVLLARAPGDFLKA